MHHSHYLRAWMLSSVFNHSSQVKCRWATHEDSLIFYHVVCHVQSLLVLYFVCFIYDCGVEVVCRSVQADPLYDCIKRIFQPVSFFLLISVQNTILNLIEQPTSLGVRQNNINLRIFLLKILGHPRNRPTRPSPTNKSCQVAIGLRVYLRARLFIVNIMIIEVLELVHEESASFGWVGVGEVIKMVGVNYRDWGDFLDIGAEDL